MAARRFLRMWISRARWAGSRACSRCGLIPARSILRRPWRALGRALKIIKEQLHAVAGHGLGYGLLRYLNAQTALQLAGLPAPEIGFNYLGRFPAPGSADWVAAAETVKLGGGDGAMPLAHCIEVNARTVDEADGATLV